MHPLDVLAADPARLAEIEAAATQAARAICSSSGGTVVDEAAVRRLEVLLASGAAPTSGQPTTRDGLRLWRLALRFGTLTQNICEKGHGPVAPTFDSHDRDVERRRGGWYRIHAKAYDAFSALVRAGLQTPPPPHASRAFWDAMDRTDLGAMRALLADGLYLRNLPASKYGPPVFEALLTHYYGDKWNDLAGVVRLLVSHGAEPNARKPNWRGAPETPLELALRYKDAATAALIRDLTEAEARDGPVPPPDWIVDCAAPGASGAIVISGTNRDSGALMRVRASTLDEFREGLTALGIVRVEVKGWVAVDSHGAHWSDTYGLAELPDELLDRAQRAAEHPNAGFEFIFDVEG